MLATINPDSRGEVQHEVTARVVKDDTGRPRLEPMPDGKARWLAVLSRHAGRGPLRITFSRVSARRSSAQNRLLWGIVYAQILEQLREQAADVGEQCPFRDDEDLHGAMKHLFLGVTVRRWKGEEIESPPTTVKLTMEQFSAFVSSVLGYWAQRGVYVEMPEQGAA